MSYLVKPFCIIILVLLGWTSCLAQASTDTVMVVVPEAVRLHSPKKAALLSAIVPGAGQIYNRQYWKVPIAVGGIAWFGYQISKQNKEFKRYKSAYTQLLNGETVSDTDLLELSGDDLNRGMETFRRNRDIVSLTTVIVYVLNIVDAAVWAHLFYFEVGEETTLSIHPSAMYANEPIIGMRLALNFSNLNHK